MLKNNVTKIVGRLKTPNAYPKATLPLMHREFNPPQYQFPVDLRKSQIEKFPADMDFEGEGTALKEALQTLRDRVVNYSVIQQSLGTDEDGVEGVNETIVIDRKGELEGLTDGYNLLNETYRDFERNETDNARPPWEYGPFLRAALARIQTTYSKVGFTRHQASMAPHRDQTHRIAAQIGIYDYDKFLNAPILALQWFLDTVERRKHAGFDQSDTHTKAMNVFVTEVENYRTLITELSENKDISNPKLYVDTCKALGLKPERQVGNIATPIQDIQVQHAVEALKRRIAALNRLRKSVAELTDYMDGYSEVEISEEDVPLYAAFFEQPDSSTILLINQNYFKSRISTQEGLVAALKNYVQLVEGVIAKSNENMAKCDGIIKDNKVCERMWHVCRTSPVISQDQLLKVVRVVKNSAEHHRLIKKPYFLRGEVYADVRPAVFLNHKKYTLQIANC